MRGVRGVRGVNGSGSGYGQDLLKLDADDDGLRAIPPRALRVLVFEDLQLLHGIAEFEDGFVQRRALCACVGQKRDNHSTNTLKTKRRKTLGPRVQKMELPGRLSAPSVFQRFTFLPELRWELRWLSLLRGDSFSNASTLRVSEEGVINTPISFSTLRRSLLWLLPRPVLPSLLSRRICWLPRPVLPSLLSRRTFGLSAPEWRLSEPACLLFLLL